MNGIQNRIYTSVIAILISCQAFADVDAILFEPLNQDILPSSEVSNLYQDSDGFLWISTYCGIVRYDGYRSIPYSIYSDYEEVLKGGFHICSEDHDGNLYFGTEKGLLVLDRISDRPIKICQQDILDLDVTDIITDKSGRVWVSGDKGVFRQDSDGVFVRQELRRNISEEPLTDVVDMHIDEYDNLWVTSWNNGLYRYNLNTGKIFHYSDESLSVSYVLHSDTTGNLWVGTWGQGLIKVRLDDVSEANLTYKKYVHDSRRSNSILDDIIYDIEEDEDGNIWVGSRSGLSILVDPDKDVFINEFPNDAYGSLPYNEVNSILKTLDGTMWVGMMGGGVCKAYKQKPKESGIIFLDINSVKDKYKTSSVRSICQVNPNVYWFGLYGRGMILYDVRYESFNNYSEMKSFDGLPSISTTDCIIRRKNGEYCFGTYNNGLWILDSEMDTLTVINNTTCVNMIDDCIHTLAEDSNGNIWIGTDKGFCVMDTMNVVHSVMPQDRMSVPIKILDISPDQSRDNILWMASEYNSVLKVEFIGGRTKIKSYEVDGVSQFVSVKVDSRGNVWVGSLLNGLFKYDEEEDAFNKVDEFAFLGDKSILNIAEGPLGQMWVTTEESVFSFNDEDILFFHNLSGERAFSTFNRNTDMFMPEEGNMVFGYNRGIALIPADIQVSDSNLHKIAISEFYCDGKSYPCALYKPITLTCNNPDIDIYFSIFEFKDSYNTIFKYRLVKDGEKNSGAWSLLCGKDNFTSFEDLKPGRYHFEVCGKNATSKTFSPVASMEFKIRSNIWISWWMILLYVCMGGIVVLFVKRLLISAKVIKEDVKEKIEDEGVPGDDKGLLKVVEDISESDVVTMAFDMKKIDLTPPNQLFIQKVLIVVNEHLADSDFKQADFAKAMAVSQTILTEKIKAMTGVTPMAFLTNARLKMAYTMIQEMSGNIHVADLAYSVGFNDAKYFSKKFKERYGISPNKMMKQTDN